VSVGAGPSSSAIGGNGVSGFIGRVLHFGISERVEGKGGRVVGFFLHAFHVPSFLLCGTSQVM
jgi:hypothetical protein